MRFHPFTMRKHAIDGAIQYLAVAYLDLHWLGGSGKSGGQSLQLTISTNRPKKIFPKSESHQSDSCWARSLASHVRGVGGQAGELGEMLLH